MSKSPTDPLIRADWNKNNMRTVGVSFHKKKEADLLEWTLEKKNRSEYIKGLIRQDMLSEKENSHG